jgi:hypothetical protein
MMLFLLYNNSGDIMDILSIIEKNKNKEDKAIIKEYDELEDYYSDNLGAYIFPNGVMFMNDFDINIDIYTTYIYASNMKCRNLYATDMVKIDSIKTNSLYGKAVVCMKDLEAKEVFYESIVTVMGKNKCKKMKKED